MDAGISSSPTIDNSTSPKTEMRPGGAYNGTLDNCVLTGNMACYGAAAAGRTLNNCAWSNNNGDGADRSWLTSASHLSPDSPCRARGNADFTSGNDIDGEAWASPPSIGCDEYHAGALAGPLSVRVAATPTEIITGYPVSLTGFIDGRTDVSVWE